MKIEIREATRDDVQLVAYTVLAALDLGTEEIERFIASCSDDTAMYSWKDSLIAEVDGIPAGCLIAYDGSRYKKLKERTWPLLWDDLEEDYLSQVEDETRPGEFFLDSLSVLPDYRGHGIGKRLLLAGVEKGLRLGCECSTLIVDVNKPKLYDYYQSIGFKEFGMMEFFGHYYKRMKIEYYNL